MAERIPEDLIGKIQDKNDIVEVISEYIPLKKSGRSFRGLCPFHSEKTPSFFVNPDKQIFHCFGCGTGGNVFSFLMKHNQIEFTEAVKCLAEKKGIKIPQAQFVSSPASNLARELFKLNEMAALFFEQFLKHSREGQVGLAYLENRKIKKETIEKMRLGYAPIKGDGLCTFAKEKKISLSLLNKAGLILPSKIEEGYYDYFRKRIIFPIFNVSGKIVGFGGRVLDDTQPKYLNSPETVIFSKGSVLYGLNFSRESILKSGKVLVVEGYFDFISVYQAGITNIVASSGTSLTEQQVRLLKRFAKEVILIYDPDFAGTAATLRGIEILLRNQMQVKIVSLEEGLDPDGFIRKYGKDSFLSKVEGARGFFDYNLERLLGIHNSKTVQGKIAIVEAILPWFKLVENSIARREMLRQTAERLGLEENDVIEEYNKLSQREKINQSPEKNVIKFPLNAEESLLKLILEKEHMLEQVKKEMALEDFRDVYLRQIAEIIWKYGDENKLPAPQNLMNFFPEEKTRDIFTYIMLNKTVFQDEIKAVNDCISQIKKKKKIERQRQLEKEIKSADAKGEKELSKKLLLELQNLLKAGL